MQPTFEEIHMAKEIQRQGPFGNPSPENWSLGLAPHENVIGIRLSFGLVIDAIEFVIKDDGNGRTSTRRFGGDGQALQEIQFNKNEYITGISGTHGVLEAHDLQQRIVTCLTINTNKCPSGYGPYGSATRFARDIIDFSILIPSSVFDLVGFFGRCNPHLESIGGSVQQTGEKLGPWGNEEEPNWDLQLGTYDKIREISVWSGWIVDAMEIITSNIHGELTTTRFGGSGGQQHKIQLKANEYITNISGIYGHYDVNDGHCAVSSIRIHTNLNQEGYGQYGESRCCSELCVFSTSVPHGYVIIGLFGKGDEYLDNIGVYTKRIC